MPSFVTCPRCGAAAEDGGGPFLWCPVCKSAFPAPARSEGAEDGMVTLVRDGGSRDVRDRRDRRRPVPDRRKSESGSVTLSGVCVILVLFLMGSALVENARQTAREFVKPVSTADQTPAVEVIPSREPVPPPQHWKSFRSDDRGLKLVAPVLLPRVTAASGTRGEGFTMHVYRGSNGDRTYQAITQVLDHSRPRPTSADSVDGICDGIISKIGPAHVTRRMAITVGDLPGRQIAFTVNDRHCVARFTFTGKHAYYWDVSAAHTLEPNDRLVLAFLDSATITD